MDLARAVDERKVLVLFYSFSYRLRKEDQRCVVVR